MRVSLFDARREFRRSEPTLLAAARRVLMSGQYVLGEEVERLERNVARYLGVKHAVGVASGTDALVCALRALGIGQDDRILTTPFSFFATAAAILIVGAQPVFADIDPATLNLSPGKVEEVLGGHSVVHRRLGIRPDSIKAILPVHLFGHAADLASFLTFGREFDIAVVEDAAQAFGTRHRGKAVGASGALGCFSFFPTKNLGGFGDGGMVVTDSDELAGRVRLLRAHGARHKYIHVEVGLNSRLDALQAALLDVRLAELPGAIEARQQIAKTYDTSLAGIRHIRLPQRDPDGGDTFHQYVMRWVSGQRDSFRSELSDRGVETAVHYPVPLHLQPALRSLGYLEGDLPAAEAASREVVSLPIYPSLQQREVQYVIDVLRSVCAKAA